jgi:hypothetical protein
MFTKVLHIDIPSQKEAVAIAAAYTDDFAWLEDRECYNDEGEMDKQEFRDLIAELAANKKHALVPTTTYYGASSLKMYVFSFLLYAVIRKDCHRFISNVSGFWS